MVQASHFVLGAPGATVLLSLLTTKSGQRLQDAPEAVVISDATVIAYIRAVVPKIDQAKGFGRKAQLLSQIFQTTVYQYSSSCPELEAILTATWRGHSALDGMYGTLDKTAIRGRWSSTKTARIHIDEAVSTLEQITLTALQQATIDKYATFMIVPRSQHSNACGGRARFPCSGSCRQWRLQQCEVVPFRDRGGPRMLPFRECGGAPDSADAARTSGSGVHRPNIATRCFGCRAQKRNNDWNHRSAIPDQEYLAHGT